MNSLLKSNSFRYGIKMFLAIGAFFLLIYMMGWAEISELRYFNLFFVVYFSYRLAQLNSCDTRNNTYLSNLASVFGANLINVFLCIAGLIAFNALVGFNFTGRVSEGILFVEANSMTQVIIALFLEGMAGAATVSFAIMQYFKNLKPSYKPYDQVDW